MGVGFGLVETVILFAVVGVLVFVFSSRGSRGSETASLPGAAAGVTLTCPKMPEGNRGGSWHL